MYGIIFTGNAAYLPSATLVELTLNGRTRQGSVSQNQWQVQPFVSDGLGILDGHFSVTA